MPRVPTGFDRFPVGYQAPLFRGICQDVIDGDTIIVEADLGFNRYEWMDMRLYGINAPEIFHPKDQAEKQAGLAAKNRVMDLIKEKPVLFLTQPDHEKYGRYLVVIYYLAQNRTWTCLNQQLLDEDHATTMPPGSFTFPTIHPT